MRVFMSGHWGIFLRTIIAACLFVSVCSGYAQENSRLAGVKTIRLVIEDLSPNADKCGISKDLLRSAFMYPASSARFKIVSEASDVAFYIAVTTVYAPQVCASSAHIDVFAIREVKLFSDAPQLARVELWDRVWVGSSNPSQHGGQIKQTVEDLTKEFVTEWNLQNK